MKFNPNDFQGKIVMRIRSRKEYNQLAKVLDDAGRRWCTGHRYSECFPSNFEVNCCVDFNTGRQGPMSSCKNDGYIVLEWDDFEHENTLMTTFNIEEYSGRFAMWLKTPQEYDEFASVLSKLGRTWNSGESYESYCPFDTYDDFCIYFNAGRYGDKYFYDMNDYEVLEWSDFNKS